MNKNSKDIIDTFLLGDKILKLLEIVWGRLKNVKEK